MQNISLLISLSQRWLLLSFLCIFSENKLYVKYGSIYLLLTEKNHYRHLHTLQFFTFFPNHDIQIYLIHCDGCILFHCMDGTLFKHHCNSNSCIILLSIDSATNSIQYQMQWYMKMWVSCGNQITTSSTRKQHSERRKKGMVSRERKKESSLLKLIFSTGLDLENNEN